MKKKGKVLICILAILLIIIPVGCSKKSESLKIATKPMTEQFILGEMLKIIIEENTNLNVEITKGIGGGTSNIHPAILKGDFDMYPEYTGTGWSFVLKETEIPDDETLYKQLQEKYNSEYDLTWVNLFGFNNTFGLVIRKDLAEKYNIKTYSDLTKYSDEFVFSPTLAFENREDGLPGLTKTYNMKFKAVKSMDGSLRYQALTSGKAQVIDAFSTDGLLEKFKLRVLEDDKNYFPPYYAVPIVNQDIIEKYPDVEKVINKLAGKIDEKTMINLNYKVDELGQSPEKVAHDFLVEQKLIKE